MFWLTFHVFLGIFKWLKNLSFAVVVAIIVGTLVEVVFPAVLKGNKLVVAARAIYIYLNSYEIKFMYFNRKPQKLVDHFISFGSNITSTENDILIGKAWTAIDRLMTIYKSDLSDKVKIL